MAQQGGSLELAPPGPSVPQTPILPGGAQISEPSSPVRLSKSQKLRAKRAAKKRAQQEEAVHPEVIMEDT